jgi:hypothetical protein
LQKIFPCDNWIILFNKNLDIDRRDSLKEYCAYTIVNTIRINIKIRSTGLFIDALKLLPFSALSVSVSGIAPI